MKAVKITIREELLKEAEKAILDGKFAGVRSLSGLIERALFELLN